jgi:superfamily II DNA or RNA helicase
MMYLPEVDNGKLIIDNAFCSSNMWVPKSVISNMEAFIRAATIRSENSHTGEVRKIALARKDIYHIVVAKHLFSEEEWIKKLGNWSIPALELMWESVSFGGNITPRDTAQKEAWEAFSAAENGVLNLACGKGKTVLALRKIQQRGFPAIVIVNNSGLMEQWVDRTCQFLDMNESDIGIVQGPKAEWDKPIVLAMIHSLANHAQRGLDMDIRTRFGTIIFDEVHHLSATKFSQTADLFLGNRYGLTATPRREDGLEDVYYAHIGGIFHSDLEGDLSADTYFVKLPTEQPKNESILRDKTGEFSAPKMYRYLASHKDRNRRILKFVEEALLKNRKILVLAHSKVHPKILHENFLDNPRMNRYTSGVVTGDTSGEDRTRVIRDSDVTFATFQVAKEGLDVEALDTLVFTTPFKSWGSFQQGKGRIERQAKNKKTPLVLVMDDIYLGPSTHMCRALKRNIVSHGLSFKTVEG